MAEEIDLAYGPQPVRVGDSPVLFRGRGDLLAPLSLSSEQREGATLEIEVLLYDSSGALVDRLGPQRAVRLDDGTFLWRDSWTPTDLASHGHHVAPTFVLRARGKDGTLLGEVSLQVCTGIAVVPRGTGRKDPPGPGEEDDDDSKGGGDGPELNCNQTPWVKQCPGWWRWLVDPRKIEGSWDPVRVDGPAGPPPGPPGDGKAPSGPRNVPGGGTPGDGKGGSCPFSH